MRYPRGEAVGVPLPARPSRSRSARARSCARASAWRSSATAPACRKALGAAELLAEGGLEVTVADARFAKPLDAGLLAQLAAEHELLVTVEEGVLAGGFGSAVWESLSEGGARRGSSASGCPDAYVTHGAPKLLHAEVGYTPERVAERIQAAVLDPAVAASDLRADRPTPVDRLRR